ncbi:MAG: aminotransferase class III-fold pyridoxal phosphate-dependent enzyme [Rhodospirillaceae bacterium]|nr:aminotransferase class III-fold pyridoxal phosphate-dependent enzyme [Rhodospirillaceae bacterium]
MISNSLPNDAALRRRARRVIPGGMYGHLNVARLPEGYPQFFARAEGATLWDVDGNAYVDFMCAYGPMVLGYGNREVEAAASAQRDLGDVMTGPSERLVELAEKLVGMVAHADWALFQRNGTDATTLCVVVARAATGKRKILAARGAYHGSAPWCTPHPNGATAEDRIHLVHYDYNDVASLMAAAASVEDDLAGVIVSAFKHDYGKDQEMPTPAFAAAVRKLCDLTGAALILDDVRAGFRLNLAGSWETVGVRPDLAAYSKAIANGYTLAAVTGGDRFREAAAAIFMTGSFWCGAASMAAALKTLEIFERDNSIEHMARMGQRFRDGLSAQATSHGLGLRQTGPAQMPQILFENDTDVAKGRLFASEALRGGAWIHPQHNMFLSTAHREEDIDRALQATDGAMAAVRKNFGRE